MAFDPDMSKPPKGWTPTRAPVILRLRYRLPTRNSRTPAPVSPCRGEDAAGQAVLGPVGDVDGMVEVPARMTESTGPKISC